MGQEIITANEAENLKMQINNANVNEIEKICRVKAYLITQNIQEACQMLDDAKYYLKKSGETKSDVFSILSLKTFGESAEAKAIKLNSKSDRLHIKASQAILKIQQDTIGLIMIGHEVSLYLGKELNRIVEDGFYKVNEEIERLSNGQVKIARGFSIFFQNNNKSEETRELNSKEIENLKGIIKQIENYQNEDEKNRQKIENIVNEVNYAMQSQIKDMESDISKVKSQIRMIWFVVIISLLAGVGFWAYYVKFANPASIENKKEDSIKTEKIESNQN